MPPLEPLEKIHRCRGPPEVRFAQVADPGGGQPYRLGEHAGPVPQQGCVISGQADAVPFHLLTEAVQVPAMVMAHQCRRLIGDPVLSQQDHRHGEQVLRRAGGRARPEGDIQAADALIHFPPVSDAPAGAERGHRVERALRAVTGKDSR